VLLLAVGGGYFWGRSAESAEIRAALSDGSASARAWAVPLWLDDLPIHAGRPQSCGRGGGPGAGTVVFRPEAEGPV
jgi:hypothetical protein